MALSMSRSGLTFILPGGQCQFFGQFGVLSNHGVVAAPRISGIDPYHARTRSPDVGRASSGRSELCFAHLRGRALENLAQVASEFGRVNTVLFSFSQNLLVRRIENVVHKGICQTVQRVTLLLLVSGHDVHPLGNFLSIRRRISLRLL